MRSSSRRETVSIFGAELDRLPLNRGGASVIS